MSRSPTSRPTLRISAATLSPLLSVFPPDFDDAKTRSGGRVIVEYGKRVLIIRDRVEAIFAGDDLARGRVGLPDLEFVAATGKVGVEALERSDGGGVGHGVLRVWEDDCTICNAPSTGKMHAMQRRGANRTRVKCTGCNVAVDGALHMTCNVAGMENLSHYAKETGLSQRELARRLGVDPSIVSRLLNGQMRPGLELAVRIQRLTDGRVVASSWVDNIETSEPAPASEASNAR
jgi:DNA-binding XRE family transcriptional regulator